MAKTDSEGLHERKLQAVRQLLEMFRMERMIYASVSILSFLALLVCSSLLLWRKEAGWPELLGLFGSTGLIGVSTARVLRMWNDAIRILFKVQADD